MLGPRDAELRPQAHRAATSVLLNLSEGLPSFSRGLRHRYFTTARGSVFEVAAAVDAAAALGLIEAEAAEEVAGLCDRLSAMLFRLMR